MHATSLRQAEQLTYVGSVTRMITHFVSEALPPGRLYKGTKESKILHSNSLLTMDSRGRLRCCSLLKFHLCDIL